MVESDDIGEGTRVWAHAHVMQGARVGSGCNLGEGVFVESGVIVGDDVTVKNGVALYDKVVVEDEVFLGPHCVFTNDLRPRSGRFKRPATGFLPTVITQSAGHIQACLRAIATACATDADVANSARNTNDLY